MLNNVTKIYKTKNKEIFANRNLSFNIEDRNKPMDSE